MAASEPATSSRPQQDVSETTPLLTTSVQVPSLEQTNALHALNANGRTAAVVAGSWVSLVSGALCICFGTASYIMIHVSPVNFDISFELYLMLSQVIFLSVISVFFAAYNLIRLRLLNKTLPVLLNVVVDLILAYALLVNLTQWQSVRFTCYRYGHSSDEMEECFAWGRVVMPVLWIYFVLSGVLGFTALFLFVTRCNLLYRRRRTGGSTWGGWRFPTGQLTIEFTVKLLRQDATHDTTTVPNNRGTS